MTQASDTVASGNSSRVKPTIVLAGIWLGALIYCLPTPLHPDVSWYILATQRFLDGARLYRDIIEVNPPLGFYLTAPAPAAGRVLGVAPEPSFVAYVFLLMALSLVLANTTLKRMPDISPTTRWGVLFASLAAFVLLPMPVFGEREHLMAILTLPYVLLCGLRSQTQSFPAPLVLVIGALAAAGFGLKPYFLAVPALLEIRLAFTRRSLATIWRPEVFSFAVGLAAYLAAVLYFHPDYITFIVPIGLLVYDVYSAPFLEVLMRQPPVLAPVVLLYLLARRARMVDRLTDTFAISAIGFLFSYLIQSKGWFYHILPATIMAWLTVSTILVRYWQSAPLTTGVPKRLMITVSLVAMGVILTPPLSNGRYRNAFSEALLPYAQKYAAGGAIYAFTSHVWVGFPLVNLAGVQWASRFPTQWLLPGALRRYPDSTTADAQVEHRLREIEVYARDAVIEDLAEMPPDLVLVDKDNPYFDEDKFDFLAYFSRDVRFAEFWRSYVKIEELEFVVDDEVRAFEIWCRRYRTHSCEA